MASQEHVKTTRLTIALPSFHSVEDALDWLHEKYTVVQVYLMHGPDGMIRGRAVIEVKDEYS